MFLFPAYHYSSIRPHSLPSGKIGRPAVHIPNDYVVVSKDVVANKDSDHDRKEDVTVIVHGEKHDDVSAHLVRVTPV